MSKITKIKLKRTIELNRLKEAEEVSLAAKKDPNLRSLLEAQTETLSQVYEQFRTLHNSVIGLLEDDSEFDEEDKIRLQADQIYFSVKATWNDMLKQSVPSTPVVDVGSAKFNLNLSKISIPVFDALESILFTSTLSSSITTAPNKCQKRSTFLSTNNNSTSSVRLPRCIACKDSHLLIKCQTFASKTPEQRFALIKNHNLCLNCFSSKHMMTNCPSQSSCKTCQKRHHTLLHRFPKGSTNAVPNNNLIMAGNETTDSPNHTNASLSSSVLKSATVLLSTAKVNILDSNGVHQIRTVCILLDSGSMSNFITDACAYRLGLSRQRSSIPIEGISGLSSTCSKGIVQCHIKPRGLVDPVFDFDAMVLVKICSNQPQMVLDVSKWQHLRGLHLADDSCGVPGPIDILIGAELLPYIMKTDRVFGKTIDEPTAQLTVFGWVLQGRASPTTNFSIRTSLHTSLDQIMERFWEVENINKKTVISSEDAKCEEIFQHTVQRTVDGRFMVLLPLKTERPILGLSYTQAMRRFMTLENRLIKLPDLRFEYSEFMRDYLDNGHMSLVPREDYQSSKAYYIPHHCIIRPDSTTTRLRVVFDASTTTSNQISLNDTLLIGLKLQKDITNILLNFRCFTVGFICDIRQMYRQILVDPNQRDYQRILWRFSETEPIDEYSLNTVTYGVASAPFLALRTLQELATREGFRFPSAAKIIQNHIYVDDIVAGANNLSEALALQKQLIQLMKQGCFELRKWASSHSE
ncbi:uncharacterized protein [Onthophagus taurus]|uniref:uncharacterized protein n=1 Tax=Onthophagus taurus TaxID=166361 RepID=UPI0039BDF922